MRPHRPHRLLLAALSLLAAATALAQTAAPKPPELVLQAPPASSVHSVVASPDGAIVATASGEGGVRLYDAATGAMLRVLGDVGDRSIAFSPDGRTIAAAGYHMDKLVGVYDVRTGKRLKDLAGHTEWETYATVISPDGKLLASAGSDKQLLVWELSSRMLRHRIANLAYPVTALAFSPDSATFAGACGDRRVRLWDAETGRLRHTFEGHRDWVCTVAFSSDGRTIASGASDWAYHRGRNVAEHYIRDKGHEGEWKLWDAATGECKKTVTEPARMQALALSPDGAYLACTVGKEIRVHDLRSGKSRTVAAYDMETSCVSFTPDGRSVLSGSHDQTVSRAALATGKLEWRAPGSWEQVNSVALSPDGSLFATASSDRRFAVRTFKVGSPGLQPGAVRLWDARKGRLLRRIGDASEQAMAAAFSPDGRRVLIGGADRRGAGVVRLCEAGSPAQVWATHDHPAEVLAVAFAPGGASLATAGADGAVKVRDAKTGAVQRTLAGHDGGATSLAYSPDGTLLACGDGKGGTHVWETASGRLLRVCKALGSKAGEVTTDRMFTAVAFTPDGSSVAACASTVGNTYGEPVRLWDVRTGALKRELDAGGRPMVLSPDGTIVATGGKTVRLFDVRTGKLVRTLLGYLKKTQALAFSPDGRLLFGGGSWGTTNAWEVASGRHLVTLFTFPQNGKGKRADDWMAYHPDGFYDGSTRVERYLAWRVGDDLKTPATIGTPFHRPGTIASALRGEVPETPSPLRTTR